MTKPAFFIIGAPKCGTTSLAHWLSEHPGVVMSDPKEPRYFNDDFALRFRPRTPEEYEALFARAEPGQLCGEATTSYLVSRTAVANILAYQPAARFIVCLRDPIELFVSLHAQRLKEGYEIEVSPEAAWRLLEARRQGRDLPRLCPDAKLLDYAAFCRLGTQVETLLVHAPRDRVLFQFLEDMRADPGACYRATLAFLGLADDGRESFPVRNRGTMPRSHLLARLGRGAGTLRRALGMRRGFGLYSRMARVNAGDVPEAALAPAFAAELAGVFREDVGLLATLTGRSVDHWLKMPPGETSRHVA